jgi:transcriptional regulator with PAS, ATPase and Fis domain
VSRLKEGKPLPEATLHNKVLAFEIGLIREALHSSKSVTEAAQLLGIKRTTLIMKMKKYSIEAENDGLEKLRNRAEE